MNEMPNAMRFQDDEIEPGSHIVAGKYVVRNRQTTEGEFIRMLGVLIVLVLPFDEVVIDIISVDCRLAVRLCQNQACIPYTRGFIITMEPVVA